MSIQEITTAISNGKTAPIVFKDLIILYIGELRFFYAFPEGKFDLEKYKHWEFLTTNANQKKINSINNNKINYVGDEN